MDYEQELDYEINLLKQTEEISALQDRCLCREPFYLGWPQLVGYPAFKCDDCGKPKLRVSLGDMQTKEVKRLVADGPGQPYRVVDTYNRDERIRELLDRARARRDAAIGESQCGEWRIKNVEER